MRPDAANDAGLQRENRVLGGGRPKRRIPGAALKASPTGEPRAVDRLRRAGADDKSGPAVAAWPQRLGNG